jgi:hypothetical protein
LARWFSLEAHLLYLKASAGAMGRQVEVAAMRSPPSNYSIPVPSRSVLILHHLLFVEHASKTGKNPRSCARVSVYSRARCHHDVQRWVLKTAASGRQYEPSTPSSCQVQVCRGPATERCSSPESGESLAASLSLSACNLNLLSVSPGRASASATV